MASESRSLAWEIIDSLQDRAGFDDWWNDIDEDIQEEILELISKKIESRLRSQSFKGMKRTRNQDPVSEGVWGHLD